jgi:hypothetical protein
MTIISVILIEFSFHCVWRQVLQYLQHVRVDSEDSRPVGFNVILEDKYFWDPLLLDPEG